MKKTTIYLVMAAIFVMILLSMCYWVHIQRENDIEKENTNILLETKTSFGHSSEGAQLTGIYSNNHELQYLYVDMYGEMERAILEYTFMEDKIIHIYHEIVYEEPFYMEEGVKIKEVKSTKYIINEKEMYDITDENNIRKLDEKNRVGEQELIEEFINELSSEEE